MVKSNEKQKQVLVKKQKTVGTPMRAPKPVGTTVPVPVMKWKKGLDASTQTSVESHTQTIRGCVRRLGGEAWKIGKALLEAKQTLKHGMFGRWLAEEFAMSTDTAQRFMNVARRFKEIPHTAEMALGAAYLLAGPTVPTAAREEALHRAKTGEPITKKKAKTIIDKHMSTKAPAREQTSTSRGTPEAGESREDLVLSMSPGSEEPVPTSDQPPNFTNSTVISNS